MEKCIQDVNVLEAIDKLSKTDLGVHYILIYKDLATLRKFYSNYTKRQIEENNEAVLINPFYETTECVRRALSENMHMDVLKHEREEALLIIDSLQAYFGQESDRAFKERVANHAREIGKNGLSIMNDTGAYPYKGKYDELVEYELSLPAVFDVPLRRFCVFHQKDFDRFSSEQKQNLVEHHGMTIRIDE